MQVDGGKKKQRSRPGLQRLWLEQGCGDSEKELACTVLRASSPSCNLIGLDANFEFFSRLFGWLLGHVT